MIANHIRDWTKEETGKMKRKKEIKIKGHGGGILKYQQPSAKMKDTSVQRMTKEKKFRNVSNVQTI